MNPARIVIPSGAQSSPVHADITAKSIPKLPPSPSDVGAIALQRQNGTAAGVNTIPAAQAGAGAATHLPAVDESKSISETISSAAPDPSDPRSTIIIDPSKPISDTVISTPATLQKDLAPSSSAYVPSGVAPPSTPPPRKRHRFRRFMYILTLLAGVTYAGGTYFALENDTFHDYFTEYIPGGEDAVLFFEERQFRQRFPQAARLNNRPTSSSGDSGLRVTIPKKSGVTWKVSQESRSPADSPSTTEEITKPLPTGNRERDDPRKIEPIPTVISEVKSDLEKSGGFRAEPQPAKSSQTVEVPDPIKKEHASSLTHNPLPVLRNEEPPVSLPPRFNPIRPIDPINVPDATEPLVQDIVKSLNGIITIINADASQSAYNPVVDQAKEQVARIGDTIKELHRTATEKAELESRKISEDSKAAAALLVQRFSEAEKEQEAQWREELAGEIERISRDYEVKLENALTKERDTSRKQQDNSMLEQALKLKHAFISQVKDAVEHERSGRLAKMGELTESVKELELLTGKWASVVDSNLRTQHLQVAVEGLRNATEKMDTPRPFIHELVAVKTLGEADEVIDAAVDCIQPSSYHRGVPTINMLITRFRGVATEIRKAALLPEDSGLASHAVGTLLGKLMLSSNPSGVSSRGSLSDAGAGGQGEPIGEDVDSILRRAEIRLEEGDLEEAAREINNLRGWAGRLGKDWVKDVRRVCEVRDVVDVSGMRLQTLDHHKGPAVWNEC